MSTATVSVPRAVFEEVIAEMLELAAPPSPDDFSRSAGFDLANRADVMKNAAKLLIDAEWNNESNGAA